MVSDPGVGLCNFRGTYGLFTRKCPPLLGDSNRDPESVGGWYVFAARLAFVLMLGCLGGLTWLLRSGG